MEDPFEAVARKGLVGNELAGFVRELMTLENPLRAQAGFDAMARMPNEQALVALFEVSRDPLYCYAERAENVLRSLAKQRGVRLEQLGDTLDDTALQTRRLELAMITQRPVSGIVLQHAIARSIVWRHEDRTFASVGETWVDESGEPIILGSNATITVAHPLHLDQRSHWRSKISEQPFEQLRRSYYQQQDVDLSVKAMRSRMRDTSLDKILALLDRGWKVLVDDPEDPYWISCVSRVFPSGLGVNFSFERPFSKSLGAKKDEHHDEPRSLRGLIFDEPFDDMAGLLGGDSFEDTTIPEHALDSPYYERLRALDAIGFSELFRDLESLRI